VAPSATGSAPACNQPRRRGLAAHATSHSLRRSSHRPDRAVNLGLRTATLPRIPSTVRGGQLHATTITGFPEPGLACDVPSESHASGLPRLATGGDLPAIGRSLAAAFADDPVWTWLLPAGRADAVRTQRLFAWLAAGHVDDGSVWTLPGATATAVWALPGRFRTPTSRVVAALPRLVGALGIGGLRRLAGLGELERRHPPEPHWYLALLGTHPDHQRRGLGAAVMAPGLTAADTAGMGCYLESSKEENVPYYRRFGFEVTDTFDTDGGHGPRLWLMWRDPRPPAPSATEAALRGPTTVDPSPPPPHPAPRQPPPPRRRPALRQDRGG